MRLDEVLDDIKIQLVSLWSDIQPFEVIFKVNDELIKNPFFEPKQGKKGKAAAKNSNSVSRAAESVAFSGTKCKEHVLESHSIEIPWPDVKVDVDGTSIIVKIMESFTVKVIKQRVISHPSFPADLKGKLVKGDTGNLSLTNVPLEDNTFIRDLDFVNHIFQADFAPVVATM